MLAFSSILLGAVGQILLKVGANQLKNFNLSVDKIVSTFFKVIFTPYIFIGLILFVASFFLWVKVLTQAELSYAYPLVSLSYVFVTLSSCLLFNETLTLAKVVGLLLIVAGVSVVVRG